MRVHRVPKIELSRPEPCCPCASSAGLCSRRVPCGDCMHGSSSVVAGRQRQDAISCARLRAAGRTEVRRNRRALDARRRAPSEHAERRNGEVRGRSARRARAGLDQPTRRRRCQDAGRDALRGTSHQLHADGWRVVALPFREPGFRGECPRRGGRLQQRSGAHSHRCRHFSVPPFRSRATP